jgi:anti-sigma factor RsiW
MCDVSTKLLTWHDGELPDHEAAAVEEHVRRCSECRDRLAAYRKVSGMVNAYCDAALASRTPGVLPRWAPAVGAAASVALLLVIFVHTRAQRALPAAPAPAAPAVAMAAARAAATATPPAVAPAAQAPAPSIRRVRSHFAAAARAQHAPDAQTNDSASWPPSEPAIQIAIPGEAMFPPGALPPGVNFVADVSIAADGSAQRLRLQPRLTGFEGRPNHQ